VHHLESVNYSFEQDAFSFLTQAFNTYDEVIEENELDDCYIRLFKFIFGLNIKETLLLIVFF